MPLNYMKTAMLLAFLGAIFVALGYLIAGTGGMIIAFAIAVVTNVISYWNADKLVLRMYGAREVDETSAPEFVRMVRRLAQNADLPMPRVYIMQNPQPNAFATGRNPDNAAVCASTGLLEMLEREEVAAVMAHELAHIKSYDTLTMTLAATIGGAISMLAQYLQFSMLFGGFRRNDGGGGVLQMIAAIAAIFLAPMAAMLVQMAISRAREYQADRLGARIVGNPLWLASALAKIERTARRRPNEIAESAPATAHLFIINPLTGRAMDSLFATHPNTQNRIAALKELARDWQLGTPPSADSPIGPGAIKAPQIEFPGPWSKAYSARRDSDSGGRGSRTAGSEKRRGPWG